VAQVLPDNDPGSGGGGGAGFPAGAANGPGVNANTPGSVTITYSTVPGGGGNNPGTTDTATCDPADKKCVVTPPAGKVSSFKVVATGGNTGATLFGTLNGGRAPVCRAFGGTLSPDWIRFGFFDAKDGATWKKRVRVTSTDGTTKPKARRIANETEICFAAPYDFVVKRGTVLKRVKGTKIREGILAHCESRVIAEARQDDPDLARPCLIKRTLVLKDGEWSVRVYYRVPTNDEDPQGRTVRKKKRRH
jgi:hypothetical protein